MSESPHSSEAHRDEPPRKRVKLACQACQKKRTKCDGASPRCGACESQDFDCNYVESGVKRGPPKGFRPRVRTATNSASLDDPPFPQPPTASSSTSHLLKSPKGLSRSKYSDNDPDAFESAGSLARTRPDRHRNRDPEEAQQAEQEKERFGPGTKIGQGIAHEPRSRGVPGLTPAGQEYLLTIYWTHIHNIWPLIYKPLFVPSQTHPALLYSMLSIASVISVPINSATPSLPTPDTLFQTALHHIHKLTTITPSHAYHLAGGGKRSHIFLCQAYVLMSLRQTRMGDKASAYLYASMASGMCLELGLHRRVGWGSGATGKKQSQADEELRSRVWWCCYILDKVLAEETGRPVLLHARRSTTPLPASAEADEYELWPPPSASAFLPSRSLTRERYEDGTKSDRYGSATVFEPAQGRLLSAFQTTCKLGVIVEEILDLDEEGPRYERSAGTGKDEEEEFQKKSMESALRKKDALAKALEDWYADLPDQLNVDVSIPRPAPTHLIVNLAWYHSAVILLHSRFISLKPDPNPTTGASQTGLYGECHLLCANAAESIVALVQVLERNKLLEQISSDVIHMLSQAALLLAYNSSLPDVGMANRAKLNFSQCCLWMRDLSRSWPPASSHRIFFEGLIQGGLELSENTTNTHQPQLVRSDPPVSVGHRNSIGGDVTLAPAAPTLAPSASIDFLTSSDSNNTAQGSDHAAVAAAALAQAQEGIRLADQTAQNSWPSDLLQLPSAYWNDALPNATMDLQGQDYVDFSPATGFSDMSFNSFHATPEMARTNGTFPRQKTPNTTLAPLQGFDFDNPGQDTEASNFLVSWMLGALGRQ
ncbi:hypothetical protein FFLO_03054 [Filobasidium floriforme]|uniref:Zn(2)-C6 fungal-type domain-containing protein n=1 Tax=Filobasidium floriforme TaxID=5210 RepID=A0A8K0NR84_9TREE|nr:hypothetical protein FFLO_03054 [Filobasidium floriforme]